MYAVADLCKPHSWTGMPLKRTKPLPLTISFRTVPKKAESLGRGNKALVMPVRGVPEAMYRSAALPSSAISSSLKT